MAGDCEVVIQDMDGPSAHARNVRKTQTYLQVPLLDIHKSRVDYQFSNNLEKLKNIRK